MTGTEPHGIYQYFAEMSAPLAGLFVAPFVLLLLSIAVLPLVAGHFWESNKNKGMISLLFGLPVAGFFFYSDWHVFARTALEYAAFIGLLGALFVVSGGIYIRGSFAGKPLVNTAFLAIGALLANVIGTTGASMLLIRPLIRANAARHGKSHTIIFFIFVVSNCAGLLTPLGDPPLFLGFLKGVSFGWTAALFKECAFVVGTLLFMYYILDSFFLAREPKGHKSQDIPRDHILSKRFSVEGRRNFIFLAMVILTSLFSGYVLYRVQGPEIFGEPFGVVFSETFQVIAFALIACLSYFVTPRKVHESNRFSFHPIIEVAVIFAGIFAAMIPALIILEMKGGTLGVNQPWQFFWLTGGLSSFLDNAPTYLTFTSLAKGVLHLTESGLSALSVHPVGRYYLAAISCGAVFMGANTYIGNGPNFMVKAIAEHEHIKMPSFFGYMLWSGCVLIPVFTVVTLLFFSGRV